MEVGVGDWFVNVDHALVLESLFALTVLCECVRCSGVDGR